MKKVLVALLAGFLLTAAAPFDEAWQLMEQGQEAEAFVVVEQAAEDGDPKCLDYLAWFYDEGIQVEQDLDRAAELYREAAGLGVPHAQWRLGVMMDTGEISGGTAEEAVALFKAAAAQDFTSAMVSLGIMQAGGRGTPQDFASARQSFEAAARLGNVHAFNEIGVMYMLGEGTAEDPQEALAWFIIAATAGDESAQDILGKHFTDIDVDVPHAAERAEEIARDFGVFDEDDEPVSDAQTV
ncbi:MAG: sel1 repeat family protein [Porphyrobacter sp.]|nr:sel1 repeat family protein [Porphyrobacter sp.]